MLNVAITVILRLKVKQQMKKLYFYKYTKEIINISINNI